MDLWTLLQAAGSTLFVIALLPQFYRTIQLGHANAVSATFSLVVLVASLVLIPYTLRTEQWWLAANYAMNLVVWGTVLYYRLRPRSPAPPKRLAPS